MDEDEDLPDLEPLTRKEYVIGECEFLAGYIWPDDLARELGYRNAESLNAALLRWEEYDLAEKFERWRYDRNVSGSLVCQIKERKAKARERRAA